MADEAFALSPISARATLPSEQDYDAIKEAFMETSRGRWFLGEYAKRNRNADTTMVLDAVARIEETLATSKKPARDPLLDEALASFRAALSDARETAKAAIGDLALEQNLAPVRKGARVIREIAWRLREIGADGRICDLIDSQVAAIEGSAAKLNPTDLASALSGAFDRIEGNIAAFDADDAVSSSAQASSAPPAKMQAEAPREAGKTMQASAEAHEAAGEPADAFDAGDEATLDMVAMEMAAPDTDDAYEVAENDVEETEVGASGSDAVGNGASSDEIDISFPETHAALKELAKTTALPIVTPLQSAPEPEAEPSLGSSLLANGIVSRPRTSRADPLAAIRRMSQTEKIAFFS